MAFGNATKGYVKKHSGGGGGGGTSNYNDLSNKPSINGVTLSGNKTSEDLGITGGGGSNMVVYNETITASSWANNYSLGAKLTELGFTGNDVALVSVMPQYENTEPTGGRIYVHSDHTYNVICATNSGSVGLSAILTPQIPYITTAILENTFNSGSGNTIKLSIRIIKAPTNNN